MTINSQSNDQVCEARCFLERPNKEIDVGSLPKFNFVEEVVSATREPRRADQGGPAPDGIRMFLEHSLICVNTAGVEDLLADLMGQATLVHVGECGDGTGGGGAEEGSRMAADARGPPLMTGDQQIIGRRASFAPLSTARSEATATFEHTNSLVIAEIAGIPSLLSVTHTKTEESKQTHNRKGLGNAPLRVCYHYTL